MKITTSLLLLLIILSNIASAQTPLAIPYQAVARTSSGNLISNQLISVRFTIHDGSASGIVVYKEKHTQTTNALGLFSVNIGTGTTISGTMAGINWGINSKFLQVELDTAGGNSYIDMGTTQMMSVPYALHAKTVEQDRGKTYLILTGDITDAEAASKIANEVGPNTMFIKVFNTTNLTTLTFSGCTELMKIDIINNTALTNISLPNTTYIYELININNNENLSTISFPSLTNLYGDFIVSSNSNIASINPGNLTHIYSTIDISGCNNLTSLNFNSLQSIAGPSGSLNIHGNLILSSINLSNLSTVTGVLDLTGLNLSSLDLNHLNAINGFFRVSDIPSLTYLNLDGLSTIGPNPYSPTQGLLIYNTGLSSLNLNLLTSIYGQFRINQNLSLTSFSFPGISSTSPNNTYFELDQNAFTSSVINNLLAEFVSFPTFSGNFIRLTQNSATIPPAPPTGQGIIDMNILISNGNTVITD